MIFGRAVWESSDYRGKTMGKSRADVVMVLEEELVGIEIKSDADTYARLSRGLKITIAF